MRSHSAGVNGPLERRRAVALDRLPDNRHAPGVAPDSPRAAAPSAAPAAAPERASPTGSLPDDALLAALPAVAARLPRARLGAWPTPVEPCPLGRDLWLKREDLSAPLYGGNKVRCLEPVLGELVRRGVRRAVGTGAWGSNQAVALAIHGPRCGVETGAILFPQPASRAAAHNLRSLLAARGDVRLLAHIALFPFAWLSARRAGLTVIPPGAAVPRGALGHLGAALEVVFAVRAGQLPMPRHIVLAVGSTCTTAGLLTGFAAARALGLIERVPTIHGVRVTPWPVTAHRRIVTLAVGTAALLARLGGPDVCARAPLRAALTVTGRELGWGYGHATAAGRGAIAAFDGVDGPHLDTTYAGKAAAWALAEADRLDGPVLFWATKSAVQPPMIDPAAASERAGARVSRWLARGVRSG